MERPVALAIIFVLVNSPVAKSESLDFQKDCAAEARMVVQDIRSKEDTADVNPILSPITPVSRRYLSHYNFKFKKCLMLVEETQYAANRFQTSVSLIDPHDRELYAFYFGKSDKDKTGLEVSPDMCVLSFPAGQRLCTTRREFNAFVARFMKN
jgi:hypothetical protein